MRFRLSDETVWTSEFTADDASELVRGIAGAWDVRIEATRRTPDATHPAFALSARLAEIDRWEVERAARPAATEEQHKSWAAQAWYWRYCARRDLGGDADSSPLRLHVWAPGDLAPAATSVWSTLCVRTRSGHWRCNPCAPRVARVVTLDAAAELYAGAVVMAEHVRNIDGLGDQVIEAIRVATHPRPRLVR